MATISSIFKMQDNATKTFNSVATAMDSVIDKAEQLSNKSSNLDAPASSINPALNQAISKYNQLISKQEQINTKIDMMRRQEQFLVQDLNREKSAYNQNEKAIFRIEKSLMNVRNQKENLINQSNRLTDEIWEQASAVNAVADNTGKIKPPQDKIETGFSKWQTNVIAFNQALQLTQSIARGVGGVLNYSDELTLTKARIDLINDGQRTTAELQEDIYQAAQRSRGSYQDMAKSVAKLGMLAGDAFKNNDEMVAFTELMNKSFTVSGASESEKSAAMYQLTQAMSSGMLQGDELRSIRENAPMFYQAIAEYTGKSTAELKEMGANGEITADIMKNALFSAGDDIEAKMEQMPKTFGNAMTSIQNSAAYYLQPVADRISEMLNSETFQNAVSVILQIIQGLANGAIWVFDAIGNAIQFFKDNMWITIPVVTALAVVLTGLLVPALASMIGKVLLSIATWAIAHWQLLLVAAVIGIVVGAITTMNPVLLTLAGIIGILVLAYAAWQVAQWATNTAMYACPIVWIIVLVIALVAAIYLFIDWIAKATGIASSGLGMIAGGVNVVIQFFKNLGLMVANIALAIGNAIGALASNMMTAFGNAIKSIQAWFWGLLETGTNVILGIVEMLNKLPFVDIDTKGLTSAAKKYAKNKAEAEDSKEEYKNIADEFNKGMNTFDAFGEGWVSDAFNDGKAWGDNAAASIADAVGSFDPAAMLDSIMPDMDQNQQDMGGYDYSSMIDPNGNLPVSIEDDKTSNEVDISDEDLKLLKDIATKDYMLNYKHITPNVNIQFGDVKETADINAIKDELDRMMQEELSELYVVEEA
jgi:tape measure domain-containing protein